MIDSKKNPNLLIMGTHDANEGYPNTLYRIEALRNITDFDIQELCVVSCIKAWQKKTNRIVRLASISATLAISHISLFIRYFLLKHGPDIVYIPYPAIFVLLIFSFLPKHWRPNKIVADAFISIHDTIVHDRKLLKPQSLAARIIFWIERRGFAYADLIIVDTLQNLEFMAKKFDLPVQKFWAIPLSTNEQDYRPKPYQPSNGVCKVLFIGTMIPLHGIDTIIQAARILEHNKNVQFVLIGDGQESSKVEFALAKGLGNLTWKRDWQSPAELAEQIQNADICLGIFGQTEKAQRVCPLKLYSYLSVGRAIITSKSKWTDSHMSNLDKAPFATVLPGNPLALAQKVESLIASDEDRSLLASRARLFYEVTLSNKQAHTQIHQLLLSLDRNP